MSKREEWLNKVKPITYEEWKGVMLEPTELCLSVVRNLWMKDYDDIKKLENALLVISKRVWNKYEIFWLPPICPRCFNVLSSKMCSSRLVCFRCWREFELEEVEHV